LKNGKALTCCEGEDRLGAGHRSERHVGMLPHVGSVYMRKRTGKGEGLEIVYDLSVIVSC